jgi:hypothetical protein
MMVKKKRGEWSDADGIVCVSASLIDKIILFYSILFDIFSTYATVLSASFSF